MAIAGGSNPIFRPVTMFDHGIDGKVEFKDDNYATVMVKLADSESFKLTEALA